jgi:mono/diheme cytochrome c family protein
MTLAVTLSEVLVTIHIIAVVAAFGGALAYPLWFRLVRDGTPQQRAFFHRAQAQLGKLWITPWIVVLFATGAYLTTDHDLWDAWWVLIPTAMLVVILVLGVGVLGPGEERLSRCAEEADQSEYDSVLRRIKAATWLAIGLVAAATFMMVARIPDSAETQPVNEQAPRGERIFVETGCGSCHTLSAAGTNGTAGPNLDEAAGDAGVAEIRSAIAGHPDNFEERLSEEEFDALATFVAERAGRR